MRDHGAVEPGPLDEDEEEAGRRRRGRILVVAAFAVILPLTSWDWYADRRADERGSAVAGRLRSAVDQIDDVEAFVLAEQVLWTGGGTSTSPLEAILGDGEELAGASLGDGELRATVRTGWGGSDRCVHVLFRRDGSADVSDPRAC